MANGDGAQQGAEVTASVGPRRRRMLWVAAGIVAALLAAAAGVYYWKTSAGPQPPAPDMTDADPALVAVVDAARAAVLQAPRSAEAWGRFGMVLLGIEDFPDAKACLERAEQLDPTDARWPYCQGLAMDFDHPEAALGKWRRAAELAERTADAGPARLRLAEALLGLGRVDEAEAEFRRALAADPGQPRARVGLARVALARGRTDEVAAELVGLDELPWCAKGVHALRAEACQRRGDAAGAAREQRQAAELPEDVKWPDPFVAQVESLRTGLHARLERAQEVARLKDRPGAIRLLLEVVRDYPDSATAWELLGHLYTVDERYRDAERCLAKAVGLNERSPQVHFSMGMCLFKQDRVAEAAARFREAATLKPDYAAAHFNYGRCLQIQGDQAGAAAAFREAVRSRPAFAEAHRYLGELLLKQGKRDEARTHLHEAVGLNPSDTEAQALLKQAESAGPMGGSPGRP